MAEVNEDITRKIANLARLELTDEEVTRYTSQTRSVLNYVDQLSDVMTDGVEPMYHPLEMPTPLREDTVIPPLKSANGKPKVLEHAPNTLFEGFKVPPIL